MNLNTAKLGIALMTDLTTIPAAPTHTLRVKRFADPTPQFIEVADEVAVGNRFGSNMVIQGVQAGSQEVTATATGRDLPILLTTLLAAPDATGLITPRPDAYGALMPVQPLAVWQKHPLADALFPAAMISRLVINVPTRNTAEINATFNTTRVLDMPAVATWPAAASTGLIKMLNFWVKVDGKVVAPETGTLTIEQGLTAADGAQGLDEARRMYVLGYTLDGNLKVSLQFTLNEQGANPTAAAGGHTLKSLTDLAKPNLSTGERTQVPVECGFNLGAGQEYVFKLQNAVLKGENFPTGLGDKTVSFTATPDVVGAVPLLVNVPVPVPTP